MILKFLVDNKTENLSCNAEWGLSIFVEAGGHKVLFDTGASGMVAENAKAMNVDLTEAECCMISHGHFDHTNGMKAFTEINKTAPVYIHKEAFDIFHGEENGVVDDYNCGILWTDEFTNSIKDRLVLTENITKINECMTLVGNIPNLEGFTPAERFFREINGKLEIDKMNHEQFLVVEEESGIHVISGCCHKGAVPTLDYAMKLFPGKKVKSFTAGMHTYPLSNAERERVADKVIEMGVEKVIPLHCTGMKMIVKFSEKMGDNAIIATAGDTVEL